MYSSRQHSNGWIVIVVSTGSEPAYRGVAVTVADFADVETVATGFTEEIAQMIANNTVCRQSHHPTCDLRCTPWHKGLPVIHAACERLAWWYNVDEPPQLQDAIDYTRIQWRDGTRPQNERDFRGRACPGCGEPFAANIMNSPGTLQIRRAGEFVLVQH